MLASPTIPKALWLVLALVAGMLIPTYSPAQGLGGNLLNVRLPAKAKSVSRTSGLFLEVRDDGLGNGQYGYRRVLFDVQSPTPVTADTQITVQVTVTDWYRSQHATTIEADGQLFTGQQKTTLELRFPQSTEWHQMWWTVWIDAVRDEHLSIKRDNLHSVGDNGTSRWRNNQLVILDTRTKSLFTSPWQRITTPEQAMGLDTAMFDGTMSTNWLDFTPYDFVYCELSHLLSTAQNDPERMAALRRWVHAGGILWVRQQGEDWQQLHDIEPLFGWQAGEGPIDPSKPQRGQTPGVDGWSYTNLRQIGAIDEADGLVADYDPNAQPNQAIQNSTPLYSEDMFVIRRHGWGMVAAFQERFPDSPSLQQPSNEQLAGMYWQAQSWPVRHGMTPGAANSDFSNWLIPGVGLAPVVSFQVLITLFVLGIGPANYWLLKRAGKLHLMLLTVPVVAVLITLGLLGYGLLSDGVATRLRAQSITLLDQQTGDATSWSRLSYYAAFAPRDGLTFSDQAAVYTIYPGSTGAFHMDVDVMPRTIEWTDDEQQLTNGWLPSRTPTQYLVVQPRTTTAGLEIQPQDARSSVRNGFDSKAQLLLSQDEAGGWWMAEEVPAGDTASLKQVEHREAVAALRDVLRDREPRFPDALMTADNPAIIYQQRQRMRQYNGGNMQYGFVTTNQGLLQSRWMELLGLSGGEALDLPPNSYVVVSDEALIPISEDDFPVEESSVHIVIGKW